MRFLPLILLTAATIITSRADELPGTILIEDDSASVETTFKSKSVPPQPTLTASGGTVMNFADPKLKGDGSQVVTISPEIENAGWYEIWVSWPTYDKVMLGYSDKVPVTIQSKSGSFNLHLNQRSGNNWVLLGTYQLESGKNPLVSFSNKGVLGTANWDAIKLIPVSQRPPARKVPQKANAEDGFSKLAKNITEFEIHDAFGQGDAETDPAAIAIAAQNELDARAAWDLMLDAPTEKTNSNWTQTSHSGSWMLTQEAGLLRSMAIAYVGASNHLGLDLRGNPELLAAILVGLERFSARYSINTKWGVNWFDFEIGVPRNLFPALIALGDAVPAELRDGFIAAAVQFNNDPRKMYNNGGTATGANLLWTSGVAMCRGALTRDTELMDLVRKVALEPLIFVNRDEVIATKKKGGTDGFYADGSFIQHDGVPYVAAYGYLLLESYAKIAECLQDTPWELTDSTANNAFKIIEICFDPFVVRGETVQNVVGRSLGSQNYEGNENTANFLITASKLLPFAKPEQAARLRSLIKKWITEEKDGALLAFARTKADAANPVSAAVLQKIAEDPSIQPLAPGSGFQMFANMDIATHRDGDFLASLGMNSTRTKTFETIWGANAKGWFQSEGMLLLYTPDIERYRDAYFNLIDPYRFPGITVERFERTPGAVSGGGPAASGGGEFVGGAALHGNGIAAMHLKPVIGSLEARRSWFFFDNQIICLGAGIGATSENPIETTLENARLISDKQQLIIDGRIISEGPENRWPEAKWAWLGGTRAGADLGWVFLDGTPALNALIETRTGSRKDTHLKNGDPTPRTMRFATLWLDHGKGMIDGSFAYAILPGRNQQQLESYATKPAVTVVSNTSSAQVVTAPALRLTGIVGWKAGTIANVSFSEPLILLIQENPSQISIAVSDPTMKLQAPVTIKLPQKVTSISTPNERIQVASQSPLTLTFDPSGANGQSQVISFTK